MTSWRTIRLQSNLLRYMLVGSRFLFVCPFPPLQIPNFKTPAIAYERDFIFQSNRLAKFVRQNKATLTVCAGVLSARMQLTQEHAAIDARKSSRSFPRPNSFSQTPLAT